MTVAELIEELKKMPQDSVVVVAGYEGGYDNPEVQTGKIIKDDNWDGQQKISWYNGRHSKYYEGDLEEQSNDPVLCVMVGRGV